MYLHHPGALGHGIEHRVADRGGVEIQQPDPVDAGDGVEAAKQLRERGALSEIPSVERRVLGDEDQLSYPARGERLGFAHDRVGRPAPVVPAQRRDDAEGALVVAALGHLDVRIVPRCGEHARAVGVVQIRWEARDQLQRDDASGAAALDGADDFRHVAGSEHGVDLRDLRLQLVAIPLAQAPRHHQAPAGAGLLQLRQLEDRIDRLLLGRIDERARIDDEHLRLGGIGRQHVARLLRQAHHDLGVDEVLGAAEGDKSNLH